MRCSFWKKYSVAGKKLPAWEPNSTFEKMASPAKKRRTLQKFIPEYTNLWPVLKQSKIGDNYAFCEVCKTDFSISHGFRDDCHRHVSTKKTTLKLKVENKHEVKLSAMLLGGSMRAYHARRYWSLSCASAFCNITTFYWWNIWYSWKCPQIPEKCLSYSWWATIRVGISGIHKPFNFEQLLISYLSEIKDW